MSLIHSWIKSMQFYKVWYRKYFLCNLIATTVTVTSYCLKRFFWYSFPIAAFYAHLTPS